MRSPVDALRKTKLEMVISLRMEGWTPQERVSEPHTLGGARVYQPDFKQPLDCFVALYLARRVFMKGVSRICHGFPNSYYICLIQLDAERLQRMLANADGQAEAWFKALLAGKESDSECDGDGDGPLGPRPPEDNALRGPVATPFA